MEGCSLALKSELPTVSLQLPDETSEVRRELTELFEFTGFRAERVDCRNSQEARGLAKYLARAFDGFAQELVFYLT